MTTFSIAAARDQFSALIERVEAGEDVVVTRHGRPVAAITALRPHPASAGTALDWLRGHRTEGCGMTDSAALLTALRDEDWG